MMACARLGNVCTSSRTAPASGTMLVMFHGVISVSTPGTSYRYDLTVQAV